ncbi:hypothetical protein GSY71_07115 [Pusillimonas sp. TS35]|uniref:hypothetical protein n=1 Tax=Paracandidimonas lactea TaxID=2895524 RepID=UPI001371513D|nr:hypothetical protein [Paracandidimonas lactea]MYN12914.1 hypothetical protein [Pusillimonas sp. TS35]
MNRTLTATLGLVLCAGLAACGTTRDKDNLAQKTAEYDCDAGSKALSAQYTFQGQEALSARVLFDNQVVDLTRATSSNADMVGNTFRGNGYTWTTEKFTYDTVGEANGRMLTRDTQAAYPGASQQAAQGAATVVARDCTVKGIKG